MKVCIAGQLQSCTGYQASLLCVSAPSFSTFFVSQCLTITVLQGNTNPPLWVVLTAGDEGIGDHVSDCSLMHLDGLSNSCGVLGQRITETFSLE